MGFCLLENSNVVVRWIAFLSLSVSAERPDEERKLQMKKAKEMKKANARNIGSIERRNSGNIRVGVLLREGLLFRAVCQ